MRIAYVTQRDPDNTSWSGLHYFIREALRAQGNEVHSLGPLHVVEPFAMRLRRKFHRHILRISYMEELEPAVTRGFARQVEEKLARIQADLIFSTHTQLLADLETRLPVVYWTDSNFGGMLNFYADYCNLHPSAVRCGHDIERRALARCALAIYTSDWAAHDALHTYGADPRKVKIVPYGANITGTRDAVEVRKLIAARPRDTCRLLFIGRIWDRKGGDHALAVADELNKSGLPTTLTLAGSGPPDGRALPPHVRSLGFVNKGTPEGKRAFDELVASSHFLVLPTRAEAYGLVFCEASSFGVPSVTTNVGGVPTVVRDGVNGKTFPLTAPASEWAAFIRGLFADTAAYERLALSSFAEYESRLNWQVAGRTVQGLLEAVRVGRLA